MDEKSAQSSVNTLLDEGPSLTGEEAIKHGQMVQNKKATEEADDLLSMKVDEQVGTQEHVDGPVQLPKMEEDEKKKLKEEAEKNKMASPMRGLGGGDGGASTGVSSLSSGGGGLSKIRSDLFGTLLGSFLAFLLALFILLLIYVVLAYYSIISDPFGIMEIAEQYYPQEESVDQMVEDGTLTGPAPAGSAGDQEESQEFQANPFQETESDDSDAASDLMTGEVMDGVKLYKSEEVEFTVSVGWITCEGMSYVSDSKMTFFYDMSQCPTGADMPPLMGVGISQSSLAASTFVVLSEEYSQGMTLYELDRSGELADTATSKDQSLQSVVQDGYLTFYFPDGQFEKLAEVVASIKLNPLR